MRSQQSLINRLGDAGRRFSADARKNQILER